MSNVFLSSSPWWLIIFKSSVCLKDFLNRDSFASILVQWLALTPPYFEATSRVSKAGPRLSRATSDISINTLLTSSFFIPSSPSCSALGPEGVCHAWCYGRFPTTPAINRSTRAHASLAIFFVLLIHHLNVSPWWWIQIGSHVPLVDFWSSIFRLPFSFYANPISSQLYLVSHP